MTRVLIVDDQELVRAGFRMILEAAEGIEVVGEAGNGDAAVRAAADLAPDVVLMDIRMPVMDGVTATRRLRGPRVIVLTTFDHDEYIVEAFRAGASAFLLKDTPPADLIRAIHVVASGDALLSPAVTRRMIDKVIHGAPARPPELAALSDLTPRERDVLAELGRGHSNAEIAASMHISETTVKTHVAHVLEKLALRDRVQAVILAYETGIVVPGQS